MFDFKRHRRKREPQKRKMGSDVGEGEWGYGALPEGCIAKVLSLTGPRDACRLSAVSSTFRSAADSDAVWERFLPPDCGSILSRSAGGSSLLASSSSKKHLYFSLCDKPILIDDGKKSFSLEKSSGKKCYMLSARDLVIVWGDTPRYWIRTSDAESRFAEVAKLIAVCWLEIRGKIKTQMLSPSTLYSAFLVFKLTTGAYGFDEEPVEVTMGLAGSESGARTVYLDTVREQRQQYQMARGRIVSGICRHILRRQSPIPVRETGGPYPGERGDGWCEIELGEFLTKEGENEELEMTVLEVKGGKWKGGLILHGIEIRPKEGK